MFRRLIVDVDYQTLNCMQNKTYVRLEKTGRSQRLKI